LAAASTELGQLLADIGLVSGGGYDPEGFDQLILDTRVAINGAVNDAPVSVAGAIRALGGFGGSGAEISWTLDAATIAVDLSTRHFQVDVAHLAAELIPLSVSVSASGSAAAITAGTRSLQPNARRLPPQGGARTRAASPARTG